MLAQVFILGFVLFSAYALCTSTIPFGKSNSQVLICRFQPKGSLATLRGQFLQMTKTRFSALPGFNLTMGFTLFYLSALVLIPFAALVIRACEISWADFWRLATSDRALASYRVTFGASLIAAVANAAFGTLLAWVLVRYKFPGRRWIDAMIDFPFALPTAVAGLTLANLFAGNGWLGQFLVPLGIQGAYSRLGIVIALTFVGLPFVVRTLQPVMENLEREVEEVAATLGAGRLRTFSSIIAPSLLPAVLTGF